MNLMEIVRKISEFYNHYFYKNNILAIIFILYLGYIASKENNHPITKIRKYELDNSSRILVSTFFYSFVIFLMIVICYLFIYVIFWPISLAEFFHKYYFQIKESTFFKIILFTFFVFAAFVIYRIKKNYIIFYGLLSFFGGIITLISGLQYMDGSTIFETPLCIGGGIFLIVDGLSNINEEN